MDQLNVKLLSLDSLLKFLTTNKSSFKNIGFVDLSSEKKINLDDQLEKLKFQDIRKTGKLPPKLTEFFKPNSDNFHKYIHAGVLDKIELEKHQFSNFHISLFSSIFSCLIQQFTYQSKHFQSMFIAKFLSRFINEATNTKYNCIFKFFKYEFKYAWNQESFCKDLSSGLWTNQVLKYLSDYLHINLFILDINEDQLSYCGGEIFVPYKKNVFLLKFDETSFEPFFTEQTKTFAYNDNIMKTLKEKYDDINVLQISNEMMIFNEGSDGESKDLKIKSSSDSSYEDNSEMELNGYDDLEQTETKYHVKDISEARSDSDESDNSDNSDDSEEIQVNETMKLVELQSIAKKLDIKLEANKKKKTKQQLIKDIKNKLE